ncbi:MAG: hypothetical protein RRZ64_03645 [Rikenellaceae bacterium]
MKYLFIILVFIISACVPGKRFERVSQAYDVCRKDSLYNADSVSMLRLQKGSLMLKVISLQQDSIRKEQRYAAMQEQYNRLLANGSQEMTSILQRIRQDKEKTQKTNNGSTEVVIYKNEIDKALSKIYDELSVSLYNIDHKNITITKTKLSVRVSVNSTLLFNEPSVALSTQGNSIVEAIAQTFKARNLFNLHIVKDVPIGELFGHMNSSKTNDIIEKMTSINKDVDILDLQIENVNLELGNINLQHTILLEKDSIFNVKRDSMMIVTNDAQETLELMTNRMDIGYSNIKNDSINKAKAQFTFTEATRKTAEISQEHKRIIEDITKNRSSLTIVNNRQDSILRLRNIEIAKLSKITDNLASTITTSNIEELNILTSFFIKSCGDTLDDNKIIAERMFRANGSINKSNSWINIIIKPDIENIIGQQKNKNIYD